ncbi:unnamed protein product, partial [Aureobasidium pullulans]
LPPRSFRYGSQESQTWLVTLAFRHPPTLTKSVSQVSPEPEGDAPGRPPRRIAATAAQQRLQTVYAQPIEPPSSRTRNTRASTRPSTSQAARDQVVRSVRLTTASQTAHARDLDDDESDETWEPPSKAPAQAYLTYSSKSLGKRPATEDPSGSRPRDSKKSSAQLTDIAPGDDADLGEPEDDDFVLGADDAGVQVGKPKRKARSKKKHESVSTSVAEVRDLAEMQTNFTTVVDAFATDDDPELVYADKLREWLADAALLRYVAPHKQPEAAQLLSDFVNIPPPSNARVWTFSNANPSQQRATRGAHVMQFTTGGTTVRSSIPYAQLPQNDPQFDRHVQAICTNVCAVLRRWPYGIPDSDTIRAVLKEVAHSEVGLSKLVNLPTWRHGYALAVTIEYIDPETRRRSRYNCDLSPGVMKDVDIDDIPAVQNCQFDKGRASAIDVVAPVPDQDGNMVVPSQVPADQGLNGLKAEKFLRYFAYRIQGQVVSKDGIKQQYNDLLDELGSKDRSGKIYGGNPLFYPRVEPSSQYTLSYAAAGNISGASHQRDIARVRTLDGVLASYPMEVGMTHFLSSGDPRIAALYLAPTADLVNAELLSQQPGISGCTCDEKECLQRIHYCQSCLRERLCARLIGFSGARICKKCHTKRTTTGDQSAFTSTSASTSTSTTNLPTMSVPEAVMAASIQRNHKIECRVLSKDLHSPAEKKRYNDMVAVFKKHYRPNNVWFDDYISDERGLVSTQGVRSSRDPLVPSVDAIEPYGLSHDGLRVHTADNIAMCTSGYNFIKYRQLVGFLSGLGDYEKLGTPHTPEQKADFMEVCTNLYIVQMKAPWTKRARLQGRNPEDLPADQAEWRAGRPTDESGPWNLALYRWNLSSTPDKPLGRSASTLWNQKTIHELGALSDEIQEHFDKPLEKNSDGSPRFFRSWLEWNTAMEQRYRRMKYTPLCLSIAHKNHGQSMATGWPREPRRLSDRNSELNNILFETWTSNCAKSNMPKKDCDILRRDIERVKLANPELYDKTLDPNSPGFPKRNSRATFADLTIDDIQFMGTESTIEVDLEEEDETSA